MTTTAPSAYVSIHDQRVQLVADTLTAQSDLTAEKAKEVAVHVVYAIDHRPETVRYRG